MYGFEHVPYPDLAKAVYEFSVLEKFRNFSISHLIDQSKEDYEYDLWCLDLPKRSTLFSAGYDFKMPFNLHIPAKTSYAFPLPVKVSMLPYQTLELLPRSSSQWRLVNTVGLIDMDYYKTGNPIIANVYNPLEYPLQLVRGSKLLQGVLRQFQTFQEYDTIHKPTDIRVGGIGSTGS